MKRGRDRVERGRRRAPGTGAVAVTCPVRSSVSVAAPEADRARVGLALEQQVARDLRRLAEAERQQPAGERVERAEVPDLRAAEAAASAPGSRRPTIMPSGLSTRRMPVTARPRRPVRRPPRRSSSSTRRAVSGVVSYSKRSSGVTRRPSARPSAPRRNGVARAQRAPAPRRGVASASSVRK